MPILDELSTREALTAVYIGYYDRAADPAGIQFWEAVVANTSLDLVAITTDFAGQSETQEVHPFFADPDSTSPNAFITSVYQNLFNRDPDSEGLAFWANELTAAINGARADDDPNPDNPVLTVGEIIIAIINGAVGDDEVIIKNKIEAALDWTATSETVSDFDYNDAAEANAKSVIEGVDDTAASVEAAKASTDAFFDPILNPPVEGQTFDLDIGDTRVTGTTGDDQFNAFMGQNNLGGVANTLSSASNLDGDAGNDRLHAELTDEFTGSNLSGDTDVQPRLRDIEEIDIEARDGDGFEGGVTLDAKNIRDIEEIGSYYSDADLIIENVTTLTSEGVARNTSEITVAMDHTENFNGDNSPSDLYVLFDNDYLINDAPVDSGAKLTIELMDLDAETLGQPPLLDNPFGLITFTFDGELKTLDYGTESDTYAELLADIQAAIDLAAQTDPDFSQLTASFGPDFVVQDTDTDPNPAQPDLTGTTIVITNSGPEELAAVTMQATGVQPAGKDFHTGFGDEPAVTEDFPVSIDIDLHKVGRGGEGGDLVVGGKAQNVSDEGINGGIEVFNVSVLGEGRDTLIPAGEKPSSVGTLTSTLDALKTVNIVTHEDYVDGDSFASLTIRDGFNAQSTTISTGSFTTTIENTEESGDLELVNANGFFGDLSLGTDESIVNLDTLTALGGGDIFFNGVYNGREGSGPAEDYTILTGGGEDDINVDIYGDALDYAGASLEIKSGAGNDEISVDLMLTPDGDPTPPSSTPDGQNEQLNQAVLDNVDINGEEGDDIIDVDGLGNANIHGGSGNDIIYTDGEPGSIPAVTGTGGTPAEPADYAVWAFNFDNARVDAFSGNLGAIAPDEIPGVQTSLAYLDGAKVTVTLSGAGIGDAADGGGVMALPTAGAVQGDDGYEASSFITSLNNGNAYYGDQTDILDAVIDAIEGSVLDALLSVSRGPNNTLLVESKTSGDFDATDLRIDIAQNTAGTADYANDVLDEARELYSNSALILTDLWGGTTFSPALPYQATAPGANLSTSSAANEYFDGLSVLGGDNSADDNLHTMGTQSILETDNVINGGADNDIIVLSTDAVPNSTLNYTPGGNNSMLDGASNETVVMDGPNFGMDVVMNFTTTGALQQTSNVTQTIGTIEIDTQGADAQAATAESFTLDVNPVPESGADYTIDFDGGATVTVLAGETPAEIAAKLGGTVGTPVVYSNYTAVDNGDGTVTFTATTTGNVPDISVNNFNAPDVFDENATITTDDGTDAQAAVAEVFTVTFADAVVGGSFTFDGTAISFSAGDTAESIAAQFDAAGGSGTDTTGGTWNAVNNGDGTVTFTDNTAGDQADVTPASFSGLAAGLDFMGSVTTTIPAGIDFLDFTAYLTSMEDISVNGSGSSDSDVSNTFIPVTLDDDLVDLQANEVAIVTFDNVPTSDTFAGLSASVLQTVLNSSAADDDYGTLDASSANADDEYGSTATTDELIDGMAHAVIMVENADNLGYYKTFLATWDGDATADSDSSLDGEVTVTEIGSLDFGTSLTDISETNLVGSDDYASLLQNGILNLT